MPTPSSTYWNTSAFEFRDFTPWTCSSCAIAPPPPAYVPPAAGPPPPPPPAPGRPPPEQQQQSPGQQQRSSEPNEHQPATRSPPVPIPVPPAPGTSPEAILDYVLSPVVSLYDVLGVRPDASVGEIRRAYLSRSKDCHPDRMLAQSPTAVATSPSTTPGSPPRKRAAEPMDPDVKRRNSSSSESSCETAYAEACPGSPASDTTSARSLTPTEPESASDTEQNSDDCSAKATAAFQRLAFAYETLRDPGARRRYDLHGEDAFSGDVDEGYGEFWWWGDWVGRNGEEEEVAEADEGPSVAEEIFGSAVKQLYEDFFSTSFDQIMAAIDIVHRLNPQLDFSREKLTRFLLRLRDLAALSSQSLASGLFASVHREVYRLSELRDEWASLSWWDIGGQLRVGIEMGRALVKIYGRVAAEARMRGIDVEEAIDAAAVVGLAVSPRGRLRMGNGMPIVVT